MLFSDQRRVGVSIKRNNPASPKKRFAMAAAFHALQSLFRVSWAKMAVGMFCWAKISPPIKGGSRPTLVFPAVLSNYNQHGIGGGVFLANMAFGLGAIRCVGVEGVRAGADGALDFPVGTHQAPDLPCSLASFARLRAPRPVCSSKLSCRSSNCAPLKPPFS